MEGKIVGGLSIEKGMELKMKKILAVVLIIIPIFVTGCFSFTKVSYIDDKMNNTNAKKGETGSSSLDSPAGIGTKPEFKFVYGKISYTGKNSSDIARQENQNNQTRENSKDNTGKDNFVVKNKFKSINEFDSYIQDIRKQSDWAMKVTESKEYTRAEINKAINNNNSLLNIIKKIEIPGNVIKTSQGKYYANRYARVEMESLVLLRSELLSYLGKNIGKDSKALKQKIDTLRDGVVPIKEYAVTISRKNMMDEEGYVMDEVSGRYIPKE